MKISFSQSYLVFCNKYLSVSQFLVLMKLGQNVLSQMQNIVTELYNTRNGEIKTVRVLSFVKNLCTTYLFSTPFCLNILYLDKDYNFSRLFMTVITGKVLILHF